MSITDIQIYAGNLNAHGIDSNGSFSLKILRNTNLLFKILDNIIIEKMIKKEWFDIR